MKKKKFSNTFGECLVSFWENYGNSQGRATRAEYWWACLFYGAVVGTLLSFSAQVLRVWILVILIPFITLTIRRLHDINRSGWHFLWFPEPLVFYFVFFIILTSRSFEMWFIYELLFYLSLGLSLILMCSPGDKKVNKYGEARI